MASKKTTKKCTGPCGEVKPRTEFNWKIKAKGWLQGPCRDCQNEKQRESRKDPKVLERKRESNRRWGKSAKGRTSQKKYRESDTGKDAKLREKSSPVAKATREAYQATDRCKENNRRFHQSEKGKALHRKHQGLRNARKKEQICDCCDPDERDQTYAAGWMGEDCYICGAPANETDHVQPLASGKPGDGLHCIDNLLPICKDCNCSKGARQYPGTPGWGEFLQARRVLPVAT